MIIRDDIYQGWESQDDAMDYFLDIVLTLHNLKRSPTPPRDLFIHVTINGKELTDKQMDGVAISLESL